jgi:hypothetical protein
MGLPNPDLLQEDLRTTRPFDLISLKVGSYPGAEGVDQGKLPWNQSRQGRREIATHLPEVPVRRTTITVSSQPLLPAGVILKDGAGGDVDHIKATAGG